MPEINFQQNVLNLFARRGASLDDDIPSDLADMTKRELKSIVERDRPTLRTVNRLARAWDVHVADLVCGPGLNGYRPYGGKPRVDLNIRRIAKLKSLTIRRVAERLGISRQAVHRQGYGSPRISTVERLACALGCSVKGLLE